MAGDKQIWTADEAAAAGFDFVHSIQSDARCRIVPLARAAGLGAIGLNHVTVPPGGQAFPHHRHHVEEEWAYVLSGAALVRIGDAEQRLAPGDFVAFPAGGAAHSVRNGSATEELTCLMGGVAVPADLVDFPELGKRIVKSGLCIDVADADAFAPFQFRAPATDSEARE